jgi:hypothetical protein
MDILARPKSRRDGRWSYSCGYLVGKGVYCPGKVAIVEKVAGVWIARPPIRREWRKRDGRYISQMGHEPNRGAPDPARRGRPRRKGSGPQPRYGPDPSPSASGLHGLVDLPLTATCDRGHHNRLAAPSTVPVESG